MPNTAQTLLRGIATGDALGVPFEFYAREEMEVNPATGMTGYGSHNQPAGTWSDDTSLTLCLAEAIAHGYSLTATGLKFIKWKQEAYWTARNEVFDMGLTTSGAIDRLHHLATTGALNETELKKLKNSAPESENGNGALMRILPLVLNIYGLDTREQFQMVWDNAALTHGHIRSAMCCMIYLKLAEFIIQGLEKHNAYQTTCSQIRQLWEHIDFPESEKSIFNRTINNDISRLSKKAIDSGGYVIESLEASIWSFLRGTSYEDCVLTAINLGEDTDTTGAITGGIAGLYYSSESIPENWSATIARKQDIENLGAKLDEDYPL